MSWTSGQISLLIQEYEKYPCLYVVQHKNYHNKTLRNECLSKISEVLSNSLRPYTTAADVQKKLNGLRNTYTTERRKVLTSLKSGQESDQVYTPSLWYYDQLEFLRDQVKVRPSTSNYQISDDEEKGSGEAVLIAEYEVHEDELVPVDINEESSTSTTIRSRESSREPSVPRSALNRSQHNSTPQARKKRKLSETEQFANTTMVDASNCLKSISHVLQDRQERDLPQKSEDDLYGEYVARRLKAFTNVKTKLKLKHAIDNLLYEEAMNEN